MGERREAQPMHPESSGPGGPGRIGAGGDQDRQTAGQEAERISQEPDRSGRTSRPGAPPAGGRAGPEASASQIRLHKGMALRGSLKTPPFLRNVDPCLSRDQATS